ncbi:hypothetical protein D3C87_1170540 [compost metagenome]
MWDWYRGRLEGQQKSEFLTMGTKKVESRKYFDTDAIAVVLSHVKYIYKPRVSQPLYRRTHLKADVSKPVGKITLKPKESFKALQSWTDLKNPVIIERDESDLPDFVLEWKPVPAMVLSSPESLTAFMKDMLQLTKEEQRPGNKVYPDEVQEVLDTMKKFKKEREYLVYVERPITCNYKLV